MKRDKISNTIVLIIWSAALVADAINAITGGKPTWLLVFCPLICLILELICNYSEE